MSRRFDKLVTLLRRLFQLDQPDLDFGFYRIMHAKSAEVTEFLEKDLLPQVKAAFAEYKSADKAAIEKELAKVVAGIEAAGMDPEDSPKVQELRTRLADEAVDLDALEAEVYDHLYHFFRRYYTDGDFLSKRVYKEGVYAIPYAGEEVKLHWANADQYYIKTSEYLRDYAFRLRPNDTETPMRVHFRLVDAAEGEHGNVKETNKRVFVLAAGDFLTEEDGELVIRFEYRPATLADWPEDVREGKRKPPAQKDLSALAEARVLAAEDAALASWITALAEKHVKSDGEAADSSRLRAHLNRYTARNTFDYFIHKDLGGFLRRELDFFIKNEVMHLDDIESETVPRVEQYLSKIKVIRRIAHKIIAFLAQLEDFQKKLWLKKKFVTETSWCVRVGILPEAFLAEIAKCDAQREEWVKLHGIDEIEGDLAEPGYSAPLTPKFLKAHPTLMVDTRHFDADFTARLLEAIGNLDEQIDGVLFHSENFQALSLMQARYREGVKCIYTDPPYNTGSDGFAYKDTYQHSSWLAMVGELLFVTESVQAPTAAVFLTIDDTEQPRLRELISELGQDRFLANIVWKKRSSPDARATIGSTHDHVLCYIKDPSNPKSCISKMRLSKDRQSSYKNPDGDHRGPWASVDMTGMIARATSEQFYEIVLPSGRAIRPPNGRSWGLAKATFERLRAQDRIWFGATGDNVPRIKKFLSEADGQVVPSQWDMTDVGSNDEANGEIAVLFGSSVAFQSPKPTRLIERILSIAAGGDSDETLDYFAGSGTTGHAVINLNREDGGRRKFLLVEMGDSFDTVLLPRLKKVTYAPEWKDGKPKRLATLEEAERSPRIMKVVRLESYEDTLNNLDLCRTEIQEETLFSPEAQGPDGFREQYLLRYLLDVETRGSASLLNTAAFTDPTAYRLKVKRPGSDESREVCVDLLETFHWLIGLTVRHIAAPRAFTAKFQRDPDPDLPKDAPRRLLLDGRIREDAQGRWWFRAIEGELRDGRKTLVIWRNRPGGEEPEGVEQDNLMLDTWFTKQGYSSKDRAFDLIYVNGTNNLENLKAAPDHVGDTWKVRLIEEDFHRLMFEMGEPA